MLTWFVRISWHTLSRFQTFSTCCFFMHMEGTIPTSWLVLVEIFLLLFFVSFMECKLYIMKVTQRRVVQTGNHIVQIGIIANGVVPISDARRSLNKHHLWNYLAVLSNAQGNAAHLKPRTSVVVLCQCFLVFASYSELARRKWQNVESITDAFHALLHICIEESSALFSVMYTLSP